jgi:AMP deaminase
VTSFPSDVACGHTISHCQKLCIGWCHHARFDAQVKMHWVHRHYWKMGPEGNDIQKTNVPNLRMRFRAETFYDELSTVSCPLPPARAACCIAAVQLQRCTPMSSV